MVGVRFLIVSQLYTAVITDPRVSVRNNDCIGSMACNGIGPQPSCRTSCAFVLHLFLVLHGASGAWALALLLETLAASGLNFCMPCCCGALNSSPHHPSIIIRTMNNPC